MKKKETQEFKEELLKLRHEIIKVIESKDDDNSSRDFADEFDQATSMTEIMMGAAVSSNYKENLGKVDAALKRIDSGTYGICENCSEEIPPPRLKALPFALYCIPCKKEIEQEDLS